MKRLTAILAFIGIVSVSAFAAGTVVDSTFKARFVNGTFINVGGGVSSEMYGWRSAGLNYRRLNPTVNIAVGKWFSPYMGARVGYQGFRTRLNDQRLDYAYAHFDLMWNISNNFFGAANDHAVLVAPYMHAGIIFKYNGINGREFVSGPGIYSQFNVSERVGLYLDWRTSFMKSKRGDYTTTDASKYLINSLTAGVSYRFGDTPWAGTKSSFFENTFISAGGGVNTIAQNLVFTPALDISAGKWVSPFVGVRFGYQGMSLDNTANRYPFSYYHGDIIWDAFSSTKGVNPGRIYQLAPYASFGVATSKGIKLEDTHGSLRNEFVFGIGVLNNFKIYGPLSAYVDVRALMANRRLLPDNISGKYPFILTATAGLTVGLGPKKWSVIDIEYGKPQQYLITDRFLDNTFVNVSGGVAGLYNTAAGMVWNAVPAPVMEITAGKWFSPVWGGRIGVLGGNMGTFALEPEPFAPGIYSGSIDNKNFLESAMLYAHMDLLCNWQNIIRYNPHRVFSLIPYVHVGWFLNFATETASPKQLSRTSLAEQFAFGAGLINNFRVDDRVSLFLDLRAVGLNPASYPSQYAVRSLMPTVQFGTTYNIGRTEWIPITDDGFYKDKENRAGTVNGHGTNPRFIDNTFVTATAGVNIGRGRYDCYGEGFGLNVAFGKWFSPYFGGRVGLWTGKQAEKKEIIYYHGDLLLDVLNMSKVRQDFPYKVMPYLHCGLANNFDTRNPVKVGAGLLQSVRIWKGLEANLDVALCVSGRYNRIATVQAGLSYNIGKRGWDELSVESIPDNEQPVNKARKWAIYTDALGYVDGTFNVGVQYAFNKRWTLDVQAKSNTNTYHWANRENQKQMISVGARIWPWHVYSGMWCKFAGTVQNYHTWNACTIFKNDDIDKVFTIAESSTVPERGDAYGLNLSLGYSWMLSSWFNLDFGIGAQGGYKYFSQYQDGSFEKPVSDSWQGKPFLRFGELSVSAMFIF